MPVVVGAQTKQGAAEVNLTTGCSLYIYGMATGGAVPSSPFAEGQSIPVKNASGFTSAQIAVSTTNRNSFRTSAAYRAIGGFGVSGYRYAQGFYGASPGPNATSASVRFTLSAPALITVLAVTSCQSSLTLSGLNNLAFDAPLAHGFGTVPVALAHTYLGPGTYAIQETTSPDAGSTPNRMADLIGIFAFSDTPNTAQSDSPKIPLPAFAPSTSNAQLRRAGETYSLSDSSSVTGDIVLFNETGVTLRTSGNKYIHVVWPKFSQAALRQFAQNPKVKPLVEPFIEKPISGMVAVPGNSEKIVGSWNFDANVSIAMLLVAHPNISPAELKALRSLWSKAYAKTTFVATADHRAALENVPRFKVERGGATSSEKVTFEGQWRTDGPNYDVSLNGNGQSKTMTASADGLRLTLKSSMDVWVFDRGNAPAIIAGNTSTNEVARKPSVSLVPGTPQSRSQPKVPSKKPHMPIIRYLIVGIGILVFAGLAVVVIKLAMPRRNTK